ncbi:MAG: hypothetical protein IT384_23275 [Deltaproteobacteria bacterium]|nr:hypothetical protein [Deltaproteobacteria bacterium]
MLRGALSCAAVGLFGGALACDAPTEQPPGVDAGTPHACATPYDVLFVLDNTSGARDYLDRVRDGLDHLARQLSGCDHQLAVITTDMTAVDGEGRARETTGTTTLSFASEWPHAYASADQSSCAFLELDHGCARGSNPSERIVSTAWPEARSRAALRDSASVGNCGRAPERGLDAILAALAQAGAGGCNAGFLRADADLLVVLVSDSDDSIWGPPRPVGEIVTRLLSHEDPARLHFALVTGVVDGVPARCGATPACGGLCETPPGSSARACTTTAAGACPDGEQCVHARCASETLPLWPFCDDCFAYRVPDCCYAEPAWRSVDFARAFEGAIAEKIPGVTPDGCRAGGAQSVCAIESICDADLGSTFERLARQLRLLPAPRN